MTTKDIAIKLNLGQATVTRYLHKGFEVGLCDYSCKEGKKRGTDKNLGRKFNKNNKIFYNNIIYNDIKEFSKIIKISEVTIRNWLNGSKKPSNKNKIYSSAHYATEEEIEKYPTYKLND